MKDKISLQLCLIMLLALVLRLGASAWHHQMPYIFGDSSDYILAARALCDGTPYPQASELPFFRAPGLPLWLAFSSLCHLSSIPALKIGLILLDISGLAGVMLITLRFNQSRFCAFLAGLLYAVSPFIIGQTLDIQSEPLFQSVLIWSTASALSLTLPATLLSGALLGVSALTRPLALGFIPLALWGLFLLHRRGLSRHLLVFMTGFVLAIAPWGLANFIRTGELIIINDAFGYNFWRGNHPIMNQIYAVENSQQLQNYSNILEHDLTPEMTKKTVNLSAKERSRFFFKTGQENIYTHPWDTLILIVRKMFVFMRPWPDPALWSLPIVITFGIWECALYLLAIRKLWRISKATSSLAIFICGYFFLSLIFNLPFQVVTRFRIPLFEWVLIVFAADELVRVLGFLPINGVILKKADSRILSKLVP